MIHHKGTPPGKKNVFFRALPEWGGGEGLARIKKYTLYIPFWRPKKLYKLPELGGGGGGGGNLGNARKKTFFFPGGVPLCPKICLRLKD